MSRFDILFDYTPVKENLNGRIRELTTDKEAVTKELSMLGNAQPQYQTVSAPIISWLTTKEKCLEMNINRVGNVIGEITKIESLPVEHKKTLYRFFKTYLTPEKKWRSHFMREMVCHTDDMIPEINNLMTDGNISADEAQCIARCICKKYTPCRQTISFGRSLMDAWVADGYFNSQ